jgi:molecular chaperone HscB
MSIDLFAFYGITPSLVLDEEFLRSEYVKIQKEWHPDFHSTNPAMMDKAMEKTAMNNKAWNSLRTLQGRTEVILAITGRLSSGQKNVLPQDFLMEMLDLNDSISEANEGNRQAMSQSESLLNERETELETELQQLVEMAEASKTAAGYEPNALDQLQNWWQKMRYLNRLRKNLDGVVDEEP